MSNEPVLLSKKYKDHTIQNAIEDLDVELLPFNAFSVHTQPIRNLDVTIQVLDEKTGVVIETISGRSTGGTIRVDSESLTRRTGDIEVVFSEDMFPAKDSLVWFGKIFKIYIGIQDLSKVNEYVNFLIGTYWIDEASLKVNEKEWKISIKLSDKMTKYDDVELENMIKISPGTPISEAIKKVMEDFGETSFGYIQESLPSETVPYTLEYGIEKKKIDVIEELRDMYMDYTCGYNVKGEFEFYKMEIQKETEYQQPKWSFNDDVLDGKDLTIDFSESYKLKDIKNRVLVYGEMNDKTGLTPQAEVRITDSKNPFNVDAIGYRTRVLKESNYVTNDQCFSKAKFEVLKLSTFQEKCEITCVPMYFLTDNDIIEVVNPVTKQASRYMIDNFDIGFATDSKMSISAHKLYFTGIEYGEEFVPLVDAFVKGINNWGWLSLGEERVRQCYNISASKSDTLIVRFVDQELGGEQASITSYATTKNQTLQIDLADFANLDFADENGANGRSKADYADRVLGHEMFHAVSNDYLGHKMMVDIPIWFKEGFAEFLHGGKDRFQSVYNDKSNTDKKNTLIDLCQRVLDDYFEGISEEYVASYLISVAIYNLCTPDQWKNLFIKMRGIENPGINFLYKLLPIGATNDEVKSKVINEIKNMNSVWTMLFNKTDLDTGSVGGIHFMNLYGVPLTAESVFNNSDATTDSIGFNLKFER